MSNEEISRTKESPLEKIARREHLVTDQGNGGSYCTNCKYDLGSDAFKKYDSCPGCSYQLVEGETHIQRGGTDFLA